MVEYWLEKEMFLMGFDPATSCILSQYSTITIFLKPIFYHYNISQANTLPLLEKYCNGRELA
jgi:hypothetical protein